MNYCKPPIKLMFACCLLTCFASQSLADNWPGWRGPQSNGISKETGVPFQWAESKNVAWKVPLPGRGGATPVVWGDRVFVTSGEDDDQVLLCIGADGKQLWKRKVGSGGRRTIKGDEANEASASPSTDGKHVFAFVGTGNLACFDMDGKEIWNVNIQDRHGKFKIYHGLHSTPLLHEDRLYLSLLHAGGHWVIAIDKTNGKETWKVERKSNAAGESRDAYTSPCLWRDGKELYLIVHGCDFTTAHRLGDGSEVWRLGDLNPKKGYSTAFRIISSPVPSQDLLIVPTARGGIVVAVKPGAKGAFGAGSEFEQWRKPKGAPDVPSPLVHGGLVYLCRENGFLHCWDAMSGKELYTERIHADRHRASPVFADGKVYCTARDGTFTVIEAGPKFKVLATNHLSDVFTASPAISNGRIYLRGFSALYAIENSK